MKAKVYITLKPGVLDPQGKSIGNALTNMGFSGINDVRQGKYIEIELDMDNQTKAAKQVERMCLDLLANTVIEDYTYEIEP